MAANTPHVPEEFRQALQADIARNPIERAPGGRRSMAGLRLRQRLQELPMPVCVVGGDQDDGGGTPYSGGIPRAARAPALPAHVPQHRHSPNVEATRCAGVLDRFVSQTVPQCLASGRSPR